MTHGYRTLHHWNQWLSHQFLGASLLEEERELLSRLLRRHYGKHALLIGAPHQYELLASSEIPCHSMISPFMHKDHPASFIEGDFHDLPILTGSIDLVLLPHTLEFVDNPRQLLSEACRIVKPEGLIAISGFNPYSLWGLKKLLANSSATWAGHFINSQKVKNWLRLADFALEDQKYALFRPPLSNQSLYQKLHFFERIGQTCFPVFGGVYVLLARAKVIPLTPIKLKWKQQLSGIRISRTISGHI